MNKLATRLRAPFNASPRGWPLPLAAACASAAPLLAGAALGRATDGATAALGGLAFLYLPDASVARRAARWMACAAALWACFVAGVAARVLPGGTVLAPLLVAAAATAACRRAAVAPPGSVFFVMAAAIGVHVPAGASGLPAHALAFGAGIAWAGAVAAVYLRSTAATHRATPPVAADQPVQWHEVLAVAAAIGTAGALAEALRLDRPYWATVSCVAVMQGSTLRAVWDRQLHRVLGTVAGLVLAWALLALPLSPLTRPLPVFVLAFATEVLIVRHYGLAVICVTPLAILMSEAAAPMAATPGAVLRARLLDTMLGCAVGLLAAWAMHHVRRGDRGAARG